MKILVTGGAGFIGANFVYHQLRHHPEDEILCLDALTYAGNLDTLRAAMRNPAFHFLRGNIADRALTDRLIKEERPDIVVNFAAESHVDRSIEDPEIFLSTNVLGTQSLMDACRKYGVGASTPGLHRRGVRRSAA
jgi:dTDP-glucose 4,6-dehydratase